MDNKLLVSVKEARGVLGQDAEDYIDKQIEEIINSMGKV